MNEMQALADLQQRHSFRFDYFRAESSTIRIMIDLEFQATGLDGLPVPCTTLYFEIHHRTRRKPRVFFPSDCHLPKILEDHLRNSGRERSGFVLPPEIRRVLRRDVFSRSMTFPYSRDSLTPATEQLRAVLDLLAPSRERTRSEEAPGEEAHRKKFRVLDADTGEQMLAPTPHPANRKKFSIKNIEGEISERQVEPMDPERYQVISSEQLAGQTIDKILFAQSAWNDIQDHIGWGKKTRDNVVEQGGIYVGSPCILPNGERVGYVRSAIAAPGTVGTSVYVEFNHDVWAYFLRVIQSKKDSGEYESDDVILGWYHTHPNSLNVFMSGTDMGTQRSQFYRDWNSAVVINPHRQLIAGFCGGAAVPAEVLLLLSR
jgi:hypothetical protein